MRRMTQFKSAFDAHQRRRWLRPDANRFLRPDWQRFAWPGAERKFLSALYDRKYSPDQPRVPAGDPRGGQWTTDFGAAVDVAGLIRICIVGSRSIATVDGITTYSVTYYCSSGLSFTRTGLGSSFPGIVIDPVQ
jgi:hypothetical protein